MSWRSVGAILMLAVTTGFAQNSAPASTPAATPAADASQPLQRPMVMRRWEKSAAGGVQTGPVNTASLQERIEDLQGTLDKMNTVLAQMSKKTAATAKDSVAKANLQLWELIVAQLDKQLKDLKFAEERRADAEARRAAMYKQSEIQSQGANRSAQQAMSSHQPTGMETTSTTGQGSAAQAPPAGQTSGAGSAPNVSASPSTSSSPN